LKTPLPQPRYEKSGRLRFAELTSGIGALVLGIGLGALLAGWLSGAGFWILLVGALTHVWGMYDKNQLERQGGTIDVWWHNWAYWLCWMLLSVGGIILAIRLAGFP
jgi:hypothetical protein